MRSGGKHSWVRMVACVLLALAVAGCVRAKPEREREPLPTLPVTATQEAEALALAEPSASAETEGEVKEPTGVEQEEQELANETTPPAEGEVPQATLEESEAPEPELPATAAATATPLPTPTPTPDLPPYDGPLYTVQPGDTLASIALMHASTVQAFMEANGLNNSADIYVGQELRLPPGAVQIDPEQLSTYVVRPGDTLAQIAARHRMPLEQLQALNPELGQGSMLRAGQRLTVLIQPIPEGATVHIVQPGESLASIAARYGVSMYDLAQANYISDTNRLDVGQQLVIPQ